MQRFLPTLRGVDAARRRAGALLALCLLAAAPLSALPSAPRAPDRIVTGDLIVKFKDTSEPGAALAAVVAGTRDAASAAPIAARLSKELGVPLLLAQVTSGREALLAVDREALLDTLAQRARRTPGVSRATPEPAPKTVLPSDRASLRLELKPGTSAQALAGQLASGPLLKPQVRSEGGATMLDVDLAALTLELIETLKQRSDVDYVQANRVLRAIGAPPR